MTTLITFDGLFSSALATTQPYRHGVEHIAMSWWSGGPSAHYINKIFPLIVVGHSLGGPAALKWCAEYRHDVDLLVTLDPRVFGQPYRVPANVKRCVNFRRLSFWMHGYPVEGAEEKIMRCGHVELAWHPEVRKLIEESL